MPFAPVPPHLRLVPLGLAGLTLVLTAVFLFAHWHYPGLPTAGTETGGWRDWFDQGHYIVAARAWAAWDLTPTPHWYPPGYPLLAAPFLWITPYDRFLLPDLACLIASLWLCAALAQRMFPANRFASLLGAGAFIVASVGTMPGLKSWLVPWTTTPATALTFAAFVAVLRLAECPAIGRALLAGGIIGCITLFRPGDAVPVALAAAVALSPLLLAMPIRAAAGIAAALVLSTAMVAGIAAAIIAATSGFGPGTYYAMSARQGFELRLLPLHWVSLVIDGRPLFDGVGTDRVEPGLHRGLAGVFPWIVPGIGGVVACWFGHAEKRVHILLATWLALYLALFLSYRGLHIIGIWVFGNYHYFKATQPIFLLFALVLAARLADRTTRWRAAATALAAIVLLFGWRASLTPMATQGAAGGGVAIPSLGSVDDAAIVPGTEIWSEFYSRANVLTIDGVQFHSAYDFTLLPRRADFLLIPLRRLPPHPGVLTTAEGLNVVPGVPVVPARQTIEFGLPCAFGLAGHIVCGNLGTPLIPSR